MTFPKTGFSAVRDALIIKYGQPTTRKTSTVQNRAGASFESEELTWSRADGEIELRQISGKIDESRLSMYSQKYFAYLKEEQKRKAEEGAKKL